MKPARDGRFPGVLFYSDIFQLTPPHLRLARRLASHGFVVLAPELYSRIEPPGTVLDFEKDRQRALDDSSKVTVEHVDEDRAQLLAHLEQRSDVDGLRAIGWCFGGHLAFRAARDPRVTATACCYATTVHAERLGASESVDTLARCREIRGDLLLVWGHEDPHIPADGRAKIHRALDEGGVRFEARLFDAEHTFMRDEGARSDPAATDAAFAAILALFAR